MVEDEAVCAPSSSYSYLECPTYDDCVTRYQVPGNRYVLNAGNTPGAEALSFDVSPDNCPAAQPFRRPMREFKRSYAHLSWCKKNDPWTEKRYKKKLTIIQAATYVAICDQY